MKPPWAETPTTRIFVPVCGTFTLFHSDCQWPVSPGSPLTQYDLVSSKVDTPACDGIDSTPLTMEWTVIASVLSRLNAASYDCSRGRAVVPSLQCSIAGCASTGRICPPPGCWPTLLSP